MFPSHGSGATTHGLFGVSFVPLVGLLGLVIGLTLRRSLLDEQRAGGPCPPSWSGGVVIGARILAGGCAMHFMILLADVFLVGYIINDLLM